MAAVILRFLPARGLVALLLAAGLASHAWAGPEQDTAPDAVLLAEARAHEHGEGVPRDPSRAAELYCDAARLGNAEAMYSLGWMYANGRGVARDDSYAATFFEMAMLKGHDAALRARSLGSEYVGAVPDCLKAPGYGEAFVARDDWDTRKYLASLPEQKKKLVELITTLAPRFSIEPRLALAIATTESNFDSKAVSPKNAMGVMQLIPETASRFNVTNTFDPVQNIKGGLAYLRWLLAYYRGNVPLAVAGYNAGEGAVDRYKGVPPYKETQNYVRRILAFFPRTEHPFDARVVGASPALQALRGGS
ncbi:transglycosylase SLT domain-containing protein [Zoogloea sp.]|uniref:transglycosylase SLT domain-containing protein n=1 Tax=Zoogloea sp. TaxID=49181 RepID=UPI0026023C2B|nr:transglycosylase SLT domain-containing protein [Zoogloea sp.]MDD3354487.1 transglycosylase SLT domain-containing protein [Zoogloea sp.]